MMNSGNRRVTGATLVTAIAWLIAVAISFGALYSSCNANSIAEKANDIAQQAYEAVHQSHLPIISAITTWHRDDSTYSYTETIVVTNGGGPLQEPRIDNWAIMKVRLAGNVTYIPLWGYFTDEVYMPNSTGVVFTASAQDNRSKYWAISGSFWEAARNEGREGWDSLTIISSIYYKDYTGDSWHKYFEVNTYGSTELSNTNAEEILHSLWATETLALEKGLTLSIYDLDGSELWNWYKAEILE